MGTVTTYKEDPEIERVYASLRSLRDDSSPEGKAQYAEMLRRLRTLQITEAEKLREHLENSGPLKPGEVAAALREAREAIAEYETAKKPKEDT